MSSENQIFLFSFMLVCRLSCSKVEAPISSHVPRSLPAQHFVVDKTPVLMTQMFSSRIALHTDTGFYFSYTFLGSNFSFFHYQIRRRKKVIISTPSDDEVTEQGQTPEVWRPPIHARVVWEKFSRRSHISVGLVPTTLVHCPSLNYQMNRESSCWFLANPSPVLFLQRNSCLQAWRPAECSR